MIEALSGKRPHPSDRTSSSPGHPPVSPVEGSRLFDDGEYIRWPVVRGEVKLTILFQRKFADIVTVKKGSFLRNWRVQPLSIPPT